MNRTYASFTRALLPLLASALLVGCTANKSDLEQYVRDERAKPGGAIEPLPTPRVFDTFTYKAGDRRSPFKVDLGGTALARASGGGDSGPGNPDDTRAREYLEDFPLDSLKMVGTIEMRGTLFALVKDSEGTVHRVRSGNYVGQNHGKIVGITETEIRISELVSDGKGNYVARDTAIGSNQ
jgi:type IV pilus assembly protein PilP